MFLVIASYSTMVNQNVLQFVLPADVGGTATELISSLCTLWILVESEGESERQIFRYIQQAPD